MESLDVYDQIVNTLLKITKVPGKISGDTDLAKLGVDSMNLMELIISLENAFNIEITDEELISTNFNTLNYITEFVSSKMEGS